MNINAGRYWDKAWTLVEGCTPVAAGCDNCWSAQMAHRFKAGFTDKGKFNGVIHLREDSLDLPLKTKKPTVWAVWNDLFHEAVPNHFIADVFMMMRKEHTFLILTKRPERLSSWMSWFFDYCVGAGVKPIDFSNIIYLGTSIENQETADKRIPELIKGAGEFKKFLSIEPMLGPINLYQYFWTASGAKTDAIQQVVCGGETGRNARPCHPDWVRSLRDQCQEAGVPFFFKHFGYHWERNYGFQNGIAGRILDGRTHDALIWRQDDIL